MHPVYVENFAVLQSYKGLRIVRPSDRGRGGPRCIALQISVGVVGTDLRGWLPFKLWPIPREVEYVMIN